MYGATGQAQITRIRKKGTEVGGRGSVSKEFFSEKDVPCPQDPYAVSKWEAEQGLMAIAEETGLEVVIIRPPLLGSLTIDSTKIRRELEWKPPYTMKHGLKETAKWYTKKLLS